MTEKEDDIYVRPEEAEARRRDSLVQRAVQHLEERGGKTQGGFMRASKLWRRIPAEDLIKAVDIAVDQVGTPTIEQVVQIWGRKAARRPRRLTLAERMAQARRASSQETARLVASTPKTVSPEAHSAFCRGVIDQLEGQRPR